MWFVLVSGKGGYKVHSVHKDRVTAETWMKCKEHDGEDCAIAEVAKAEEFAEEVARLAENFGK